MATTPGLAQTITEPGWDPDTVQVRYYDDCCPRPFPPSARFPYHGVSVRTRPLAAGAYEDQLRDAESLRLLLTVRHRPAAGHAELTMYYPAGGIRLRAQLLEDATAPVPVVFIVPSLHRPLSAYAAIDGILQTFYPNGAIRQQAEYRLGQRVRSECYDSEGRPAACNANPPVVAPILPAVATSGQPFLFVVRRDDSSPGHPTAPLIKSKAVFQLKNTGEPLALRILLPRRQISAESVALVANGGRFPISFGLAANAPGSRGTGSFSGALNQELRAIGMQAGRLFYNSPEQPLRPVLLDGEPVATYSRCPSNSGC